MFPQMENAPPKARGALAACVSRPCLLLTRAPTGLQVLPDEAACSVCVLAMGSCMIPPSSWTRGRRAEQHAHHCPEDG